MAAPGDDAGDYIASIAFRIYVARKPHRTMAASDYVLWAGE
jgi:hypothetical protein